MTNTVVDTFSGHLCVDCALIICNGEHCEPDAEIACEDGAERIAREYPGAHFIATVGGDSPQFMDDVRCYICRADIAGDYWPAMFTFIER